MDSRNSLIRFLGLGATESRTAKASPMRGRRAGLVLFRSGLWAMAVAAIISGCNTTVQSPSYYPPVTSRPVAAAPSRPS